MAQIDSRIVPIVETLVRLDLDWLAFEIIDKIRTSGEPQESEENLRTARERTQSNNLDSAPIKKVEPVDNTPLTGNRQLDWVVTYIEERITTVLSATLASIENLAAISQSAETFEREGLKPPKATLAYGEKEAFFEMDREQLQNARNLIEPLKTALDDWRNSAPPADPQ